MTALRGGDHADAPPREERGQLLLEVSNAVVRIHKQLYGKGPTKARAHLAHDLLTVILEGGFTRTEETLMAHGRDDEVARWRSVMQGTVEQELRTAVEQVIHRAVRSFMSANDPVAGLQAEIFVLDHVPHEPVDEDDLTERARRAREQHREILDEHRALRAEQVQALRAGHLAPERRFGP